MAAAEHPPEGEPRHGTLLHVSTTDTAQSLADPSIAVTAPETVAPRLAVIDVGSNSVRLTVTELLGGGRYRVLDEERETTRLARNLDATGLLDAEAMEQTLTALRRFRQIASGFQAAGPRMIATCAVREADNGPEFARRVSEEIGIELEVISGDQEAHLAFASVRRAFDLTGRNVLVADIGGGSTELIFASGDAIEAIFSTPLGAVRLTERHGCGNGLTGEDFQRLTNAIDRSLRRIAKKASFAPHLLIGSGGTFTTLGEMIAASKGQKDLPVQGALVTRADLSHLLDQLRKMPLKNRRSVPGLNPDRADIIIAGLTVIDRLMQRFHLNVLNIHARGVRDGLLLSMMNEDGRPADSEADRAAAVERFAAACSGDVRHGRHVAKLCRAMYSQLAEPFSLDPQDGLLLESAAMLQDVGYLIDYERHHKHSYQLVLNSRLPGFQPSELELLANVARYHRGAKPKKKHANFSQLSPQHQQRVRQMAAILRVAGGLDRSHTQQVQSIALKSLPDHVDLCVQAAEQPEVDLWGARRRADLFEEVFGLPLVIEWQPPSEQQ